MKMASGDARPSSACGASPATISISGVPSALAFSAMNARRLASLSTAIAFISRPARSHSIAMEPQPAPISQSRCPGKGASAARVAARISRLVSCPSWRKASSGSPGRRGRLWAPGSATHSTARVLRSAVRADVHVSAVASRIRSCAAAHMLEDDQAARSRTRAARARRRPGPAWCRHATATAAAPRGRESPQIAPAAGHAGSGIRIRRSASRGGPLPG